MIATPGLDMIFSSWLWLATPPSCLVFRLGSIVGSQQDSSPTSSNSTPLSNSNFYGIQIFCVAMICEYLSQDRLHQKPVPHCFIFIVEKCKVIGVSDWSWNMAEHGSKVRNISWEQSSTWVLFTAFVRRWMCYLRTRTYPTDWLVMIIVKIFFELTALKLNSSFCEDDNSFK